MDRILLELIVLLHDDIAEAELKEALPAVHASTYDNLMWKLNPDNPECVTNAAQAVAVWSQLKVMVANSNTMLRLRMAAHEARRMR